MGFTVSNYHDRPLVKTGLFNTDNSLGVKLLQFRLFVVFSKRKSIVRFS